MTRVENFSFQNFSQFRVYLSETNDKSITYPIISNPVISCRAEKESDELLYTLFGHSLWLQSVASAIGQTWAFHFRIEEILIQPSCAGMTCHAGREFSITKFVTFFSALSTFEWNKIDETNNKSIACQSFLSGDIVPTSSIRKRRVIVYVVRSLVMVRNRGFYQRKRAERQWNISTARISISKFLWSLVF